MHLFAAGNYLFESYRIPINIELLSIVKKVEKSEATSAEYLQVRSTCLSRIYVKDYGVSKLERKIRKKPK